MSKGAVKQTTGSALILGGIIMLMLIGKVYPDTVLDFWPWPLAAIFMGIGNVVGLPVLSIFGGMFALLGVLTYIV